MEIFPYMISVLMTALVIYWSGGTSRPGSRIGSLFRYRGLAPPGRRRGRNNGPRDLYSPRGPPSSRDPSSPRDRGE